MRRTAATLVLTGLGLACSDPPESSTRDEIAVPTPAERDFEADLVALASTPRPPGSPGWRKTQNELRRRLESLGLQVELERYESGVNVIGTKLGASRPQERVYLTAHYDSIPDCPGGNDNGSGLAGVLLLAKRLARARHGRTLVVAFFDEEETGLKGSSAHAISTGDVKIVFNLDAFGYRDTRPFTQRLPRGFGATFPAVKERLDERDLRADFVALLANEPARQFAWRAERGISKRGSAAVTVVVPDALLESPWVSDFRRSDHAPFWRRGVAAIHVTDTAEYRNPSYHCREAPDTASTVDVPYATAVSLGLLPAIEAALRP